MPTASIAASAANAQLPKPTPASSANFYQPGAFKLEDAVGHLMKRALSSMVYQADKRLAAADLTYAQWAPLLHLSRSSPCAVAELARLLPVDPGAMTRLLDRLEKKGLCQRVRSTADRRVVQVDITPAGRAAIVEVSAVLADVMNLHLASFSEDECTALTQALRRMVAAGEALRAAE